MGVINRDERVLLVVADLTKWADPDFHRLYEWLDQNAVNVAKVMMGLHYRLVDTLIGTEATSANFVERLITLAEGPQTKAVDVFLHLHGLENELFFEEGPVEAAELGDQLKEADLKERLRLLYSTACFGATHAPDFVRGGFRVVSGAVSINANGPYDYPAQLFNWGLGQTYRMVVQAGNNPMFMVILDNVAKAMGFDDVNSKKEIKGRVLTRIMTEAD